MLNEIIFIDIRFGYGGAEKFFDNLCLDLKEHTSLSFNLRVFNLNKISKMSVLKELFKIKRQTVVFNMSVLGIGILYLLILKIMKNKIILYPHLVTSHYKIGSKFPFIRNIYRLLSLYLSSTVIAISDGNFKILKCYIPEVKIKIIYNYIRENLIDCLNSNLQLNHFAIIGRFQNKHKQQLSFLQNCRDFIIKKNMVLHLFGDGPDFNSISNFVKNNNLSSNVILHGWIDEKLIYNTSFSTVISVSEWEGLPLNLLEAFGNNRIVIGKRIEGIEELLYGDFLFNDFEECMQIISKLLTADLHMKTIYQLNKQYVHTKYSINSVKKLAGLL